MAMTSLPGNVVYDKADGQWHLFFAEFLNHCGLGSWGTNSVVSHAVAATPAGPFTKKETVLPPFHHNPTIAYDPSTETFLLISIGNGTAGPPPVVPNNCSSSGPTDRRADSRLPPGKAATGSTDAAASSEDEGAGTRVPGRGEPPLTDPVAAGIITLWTSARCERTSDACS